MKKKAVRWLVLLGLFLPASSTAVQVTTGQDTTFQGSYALISEADLYCSFFVLEETPRLKIAAGERGAEKMLLADGDLFYFKARPEEGLAEGQVMMILEVGPKVAAAGSKTALGPLAFRRSRARLVRCDKGNVVLARVEKACSPVRVGYSLVPFVEKEGLLGRDLGYDVAVKDEGALTGQIVFLNSEFLQIGAGQWALIDLGLEAGLQVGQQLTLARRGAKGLPLEAFGNAIVVDAGRQTATIKVLSSRDAVRAGDFAQVK